MILSKLFQHHFEALNMIFYEPKHRRVIEVDLKKLMNKILESSHYYPGKYSRNILDSKGHSCFLKTSPLRRKGCLLSIFLQNYDVMVAR